MLKFARFFFIIFLVTTFLPLLLMFLWDKHLDEEMITSNIQYFLKTGIKRIQLQSNQYLKIRDDFILQKMQKLPHSKIALSMLSDILDADKVESIYGKNIDKIKSYYEVIKLNPAEKLQLYVISIVPYKVSGITGIKIIKKVDLKLFHPSGPFHMRIYMGNKINKNSLLGIVFEPFFQSLDNNKSIYLSDDLIDPSYVKYTKITDIKGKTVLTIALEIINKTPLPSIKDAISPIILITGSILSLLLGFYINKNFVNPLMVLSNASKRVQEGDLSFELDIPQIKQDQILNTFENFNQMIKGLKEKKELRKSFITNLTHDLRTPLIAQERALELISGEFELLGLKDAYELAKGIEKNNKHLLRIVNLILESYGFDSENLVLIMSNINISELIDSCYENLKPLALEKNIQLLNNVSKDFSIINGDKTSFRRIFLNLISNAIENISKNGIIKVNAESCDDFIKIIVEDNGPGIAPKDLNHIFDRYFTGKSDERKVGSGLGLYVCKKLVEMHNGKISVESSLNQFTRFIIKLSQ